MRKNQPVSILTLLVGLTGTHKYIKAARDFSKLYRNPLRYPAVLDGGNADICPLTYLPGVSTNTAVPEVFLSLVTEHK